MSRERRATGQLTLRVPVDFHAELLLVADTLGLDVNSLLNEMLRTARPQFVQRAAALAKEHRGSRDSLDAALAGTDDPAVREALAYGREWQDSDRINAVVTVALRHRDQLGGVPVEVWVARVLETLHQEDLVRQAKEAVEAIASQAAEQETGRSKAKRLVPTPASEAVEPKLGGRR